MLNRINKQIAESFNPVLVKRTQVFGYTYHIRFGLTEGEIISYPQCVGRRRVVSYSFILYLWNKYP